MYQNLPTGSQIWWQPRNRMEIYKSVLIHLISTEQSDAPGMLCLQLKIVFSKLTKAKIFTVLDTKKWILASPLDEESSYLTTMWTLCGRVRWLRMPFGIKSASEEFQRRMCEIFGDLPGIEIIADDILVFGSGETMEEAMADHDSNLIRVLECARMKGVKFNKEKMKLRQDSVRYMGDLLTADGLKADPEKVKAVVNMPKPANVKQVQRLVGFVNYLAQFLPQLPTVCEPLRKLICKDNKWMWESQQEEAFSTIKDLVIKHPVLTYHDVQKDVTIQCDASDCRLGASLMQEGQPVAYASRALSQTERNYAQIEKDSLAICFGCDKFYQYIYGRRKVEIETDHKPLVTIFKKPLVFAPRRIQIMMLRLQKYNLELRYQKGKDMFVSDTLSRAYLIGDHEDDDFDEVFYHELEEMDMSDGLAVSEESFQKIHYATSQDQTLQSVKMLIHHGWPEERSKSPPCTHPFWNNRDELTIQNEILFKGMKVVILQALRHEMIKRTHSSHLGVEASVRKAIDVSYWPGMNDEIRDFTGQCSTCNQLGQKQCKEPRVTHEIPNRPWSKVGMDLFSCLGKEYLITVDYYSDFWELDLLPANPTAASVITKCKINFSRHGIPKKVVSDSGSQFVSEEFANFAKEWEFSHKPTIPYYSRSNGIAEAAVKIAKTMLKKSHRDKKDPWLAILDWRNTPTEQIGTSPVQRLMSRRTRTRLPTADELLNPEFVNGVTQKIEKERKKAKFYCDRTAKKAT